MPIPEEHELIQGCIAQDRKIQNCLYRQYYAPFLKICLRYADNQEDAEQWMNDGFYKIFTRIDQYKHKGSFEGWMKRIMIHTCLDNLKSAINKKQSALVDLSDTDATHMGQVSYNGALQQIGFKELIKHIQNMQPMHKAVFNLYVFEGYTHAEIASELNIKEGTSAWYLNQARKQLQQELLSHQPKNIRNEH